MSSAAYLDGTLLNRDIFSVQRADELMAEVDSARAKARNAVDLGERTLIEANDTLTTLLGKLLFTGPIAYVWTLQ